MRFTFLFSAENKGLARKTKYKKDNNYLQGIILHQWNLITYHIQKNFISCNNDSALFDRGLNSLNTFPHNVYLDFQEQLVSATTALGR